jgi:hypothetical protein
MAQRHWIILIVFALRILTVKPILLDKWGPKKYKYNIAILWRLLEEDPEGSLFSWNKDLALEA